MNKKEEPKLGIQCIACGHIDTDGPAPVRASGSIAVWVFEVAEDEEFLSG